MAKCIFRHCGAITRSATALSKENSSKVELGLDWKDVAIGEIYIYTYVIQDTHGIHLTVKTSTFTCEGVTQDKVNLVIKNFLSLYVP